MRRILTLFLCGYFFCGNLPAGAFEPKDSGPPVLKVPVFYATDREKITSNKEEVGHKLSSLKTGCATVMVPMQKRFEGEGKESLTEDLNKLGCTIDKTASTMEPYIEIRGYVAEPEPQKVLIDVKDCDDMYEKLKTAAQKSKSVYVYIHGFASSGNNALYSGGILSANLEAPVVSFTWPSKGTAGMKFIRFWGRKRLRALYLDDRKMIDDPKVMADLKSFLKELRAKMPPDVSINLVAHSLGNRLMAKYLNSYAEETYQRVYFLAPDVDKDLFIEVAGNLKKKAKYVAVFHNPKDRVLKISAANDLLSLKETDKLGTGGADLTGIEFIDYRKIAEPRSLEFLRVLHYVPFEHFANIIRSGISNIAGQDEVSYIVRRSVVEKRKREKIKTKTL